MPNTKPVASETISAKRNTVALLFLRRESTLGIGGRLPIARSGSFRLIGMTGRKPGHRQSHERTAKLDRLCWNPIPVGSSACMFSPFCLGELTAECPWSTLQSGTRAVHMDALGPKKGKCGVKDSLGYTTRLSSKKANSL